MYGLYCNLSVSVSQYLTAVTASQDALLSPGDLVAELLAGDDGDLLTHALVGVEVVAQAGVVLLDDDPSGLLHRLGPDSTLQHHRRRTSETLFTYKHSSSSHRSDGSSAFWADQKHKHTAESLSERISSSISDHV